VTGFIKKKREKGEKGAQAGEKTKRGKEVEGTQEAKWKRKEGMEIILHRVRKGIRSHFAEGGIE